MRFAVVVTLLVGVATPTFAQDRAADETAIRAELDKISNGRLGEVPKTSDWVFWSGAYVRPVVGNEKLELRPGSTATGTAGASGGANRKRENFKTTVRLVQLKFSAAGDMASEYSTVHTSFDQAEDKRHVEFDAAVLRVWRRENGQWKIAASFQQPFNTTPAEP